MYVFENKLIDRPVRMMYVVVMTDKQIILERGGIRPLARKLGHKNQSTVQGWMERGNIPDRHRDAVMAIAPVKVST